MINLNKCIIFEPTNKTNDMTTLNTTSEKQEKLIQFFIEMGYNRNDIKKHYADPIKRKALNAMAEGL